MQKMMAFAGMTVGGWVGWAIGVPFSYFVAFLLMMVGTGLGLWGGRVLANKILS